MLPVRLKRGKVFKDCFRTWMRKLLIKVSDSSTDAWIAFLGFLSHFMDVSNEVTGNYCIFNLISTSRNMVGAGQTAWSV